MPLIPKPNQHFDVVTYTGNSSTQNLNLNFTPDLVWIKDRSTSAPGWATDASFSSTAYIPTVVYGNNGKIYVMGGDGGTGTTRTDNRIYDIAANTWSSGTAVPGGTQGVPGFLYNNRIYLIGGQTGNNVYTNRVIYYDIALNSWTTVSGTAPGSALFCGALVGNKFYSFRRISGVTSIVTDIYNVDTNTWTTGTSFPYTHTNYLYEYAVIDDKIYVIGGSSGTSATGTVAIYNTTLIHGRSALLCSLPDWRFLPLPLEEEFMRAVAEPRQPATPFLP